MYCVKYITLFATLLCAAPSPSHAQSNAPNTNATQYFINKKAKADADIKTPKASDFIQSRSTAKQDAPPASKDTSKDAAAAAWKRYKALASGTSRTPKTTAKKIKTPTKPDIQPTKLQPLGAAATPQPATATPAKKSTGLQQLLEQYNKSKEKRGTLNTITINKPTVATPASSADQ